MKKNNFLSVLLILLLGIPVLNSQDQVTYRTDFNHEIDFLYDDLSGTIWTGAGGNLGKSETQNAGILAISSADGELTMTSDHSDWSSAGDDGPILYRTVHGGRDFTVTAKVSGGDWETFTGETTPEFNTGGLIVRNADAPLTNILYFQSFDNFGISYIIKNTVDNLDPTEGLVLKADDPIQNVLNLEEYAYQRITRTGNVFKFSLSSDSLIWVEYFTADRTDFGTNDLQVGLAQCTHSDNMATAKFSQFALTHEDYQSTLIKDKDFSNNVSVFYNSGTHEIDIVSAETPFTNVNIYRIDGSLIDSYKKIKSYNFKIAMSQSGIYIVSLTTSTGGRIAKKIVVH
jgi:regulation of enolase protein 1 (concanavalin A-like superfamily)